MSLGLNLDNEESYKDLFDNAHDMVHFATPEGTLIYVNSSWLKVLGYEMEEIRGRSIFSFIHPDYREQFADYRKSMIENQAGREDIIFCMHTKQGSKVYVEGSVTSKLKDGKVIYTRGIFREITERLKNEQQLREFNQALQERENNLKQLLNNAPDSVIVIDANSNILFWNPKAEEVFGFTVAEVIGKNLSDKIIPVAYRDAHNKGMKRFLATGEMHVINKTIEITALKKNGEEFYISLTISTTKQTGQVAFIAFIRDISVQKRNELELENKRKELIETNKELEQFAFAASHDMQEPLRKIQTFASILLDHEKAALTENGKNYLEKIATSAQRMKSLIDALLHFSYTTQQSRQFIKTDLNEILRIVQSDLELTIEQKQASLEIATLPVIDAIPVQMEQLFYNLMNNALKFARPDSFPAICIGYTFEPEHLGTITLFVKDNGIGFEQHHAKKIFGLFQRLNDRYSYEGTGIGLTLCKKIVSHHNGEISATSRPGEGATFFVRLPVRQQSIGTVPAF